jgi:hypothetical protein
MCQPTVLALQSLPCQPDVHAQEKSLKVGVLHEAPLLHG